MASRLMVLTVFYATMRLFTLPRIWRHSGSLSGIGSAGNKNSCVYCNANNGEREYVGAEVTSLTVPSNWRTDLKLIFGIPWGKSSYTLHAHTRTTEKLLKQVAVKSAYKDMRQTKQRTKLEALVRRTVTDRA